MSLVDDDSYGHHCPKCNHRVVTVWAQVPAGADKPLALGMLVLGAILVAAGLRLRIHVLWVVGLLVIASGVARLLSRRTERVRQCPICQTLCRDAPAAGGAKAAAHATTTTPRTGTRAIAAGAADDSDSDDDDAAGGDDHGAAAPEK